MNLGFRGKLLTVSFFVVLAMVGAGLLLSQSLRTVLTERVEAELFRHADVAAQLIVDSESVEDAASILHAFGKAKRLTLSLVRADGRSIAHSQRLGDRLPEVEEALDSGRGRSERSPEGDGVQKFVAITVDGQLGKMVLQVGSPLDDVEETISQVELLIALIAILAIVIALFMSGLASRLTKSTLRNLAASARDSAHDGLSEDESSRLEESVSEMAAEVQSTVAELAKERALVKAVLKGMSEAVVALDRDRLVTLMNPAAVELLGLSAVPVGRSILEVLRVPALQQLVGDRPLEGPDSAEFEIPNGRHVLARIRPQRGQQGSVLVMHDVTDVRRLETIRRDFVANVSHELRTPVAIIRANSETLLDGALDDPDASQSLIDALHRNAKRLSNIIDDLLDLSRIEAGRYELELEAVSISMIADSAVKSIERSASKKQIHLTLDIDADVACLADSKALEQVLFNLLDNAVKYTPEGGTVRIAAVSDDDECRILLEDNGPGIEPRHRERIFERFYRVDPGRSRVMGGTGLGLAIVRHLVEAMGGEVSVQGSKPNGSIFCITLPVVQSQRQPVD